MKLKLAYWICTGLIVLQVAMTGINDVLRTVGVMEITVRLGYPSYFPVMLGVAKLLGVVALIARVPRTLREWAYAGFSFEFISAFVSHVVVGDIVLLKVLPLITLAVLLVSYWSWRALERRHSE